MLASLSFVSLLVASPAVVPLASPPPVVASSAPSGASAADYFLGTWTCGGDTAWTFARSASAPGWIQDVYGDPAHPAGTAFFGYVEALHAFVYRDFHADGAYADLTATVADGRWTFTGPYYPAGAVTPLNGRITYVEVSRDRYDRSFGALVDGKIVVESTDSCVKARS